MLIHEGGEYRPGDPDFESRDVLEILYHDYRRPISAVISGAIPEGMVSGSTVPLWWPNYRGGSTLVYEVRRPSDVVDINADGVEGDCRTAWDFSRDDTFVVFGRDESIAGVTTHVVVVGNDGEVRFAHEEYRGTVAGGGYVGQGERSRILPPQIGAAIVGNMCGATAVILDDDLLLHANRGFRGLARDMWAHSLSLSSLAVEATEIN